MVRLVVFSVGDDLQPLQDTQGSSVQVMAQLNLLCLLLALPANEFKKAVHQYDLLQAQGYLQHCYQYNICFECIDTLLTISAADVKISVAAIFFTAVETLVAVAAPSCGGCI
jgi:hypothetical protein